MSRWRRKRRTTKTLVLIVLAVGAFVALSPSTWHEAVRHAFGEGSSGATLARRAPTFDPPGGPTHRGRECAA